MKSWWTTDGLAEAVGGDPAGLFRSAPHDWMQELVLGGGIGLDRAVLGGSGGPATGCPAVRDVFDLDDPSTTLDPLPADAA
jgi:hypothetical protein